MLSSPPEFSECLPEPVTGIIPPNFSKPVSGTFEGETELYEQIGKRGRFGAGDPKALA